MILYCFDESGAYTGPVSPSLSPARPFVNGQPNYLRPARTTDMAPPQAEANQVPVFDGASWTLVEDHRGTVVFDVLTREPRSVKSLGPLPEGCVPDAPPSAQHVWSGGQWREDEALLLEAARRERNARIAACDWTQLPDAPFTATRKLAWAEYRQALRDYPSGWTKAKPWPQPPQE